MRTCDTARFYSRVDTLDVSCYEEGSCCCMESLLLRKTEIRKRPTQPDIKRVVSALGVELLRHCCAAVYLCSLVHCPAISVFIAEV